MSPPDSVRVPVLVDDNLGGADGDGARFVVGLQIVFAQEHSVGATAAWPQTTRKQGSELLWSTLKLLLTSMPYQYNNIYYH